MQVGRFEKVNFEQFSEAMIGMPFAEEWEFYDEWIYDLYERIMLPTKATSGSAGYDFKVPFFCTGSWCNAESADWHSCKD